MSCGNKKDIWDYRCYETGEVIIVAHTEKEHNLKVRLHKKRCPTCVEYDDKKIHRLSVETAVGGKHFTKKKIANYKDTDYENGLPEQLRNAVLEPSSSKWGAVSSLEGREVCGDIDALLMELLLKQNQLRRR